jgi:hypothetical protein
MNRMMRSAAQPLAFAKPPTIAALPRLMDQAWSAMTAACDLGDHEMIQLCRRVIDAQLLGRAPLQSDVACILNYFR